MGPCIVVVVRCGGRRLPRCPADSAVLNKESRLSQGGHLSSGLYYVYVDVGGSNAAKVLEVREGASMQIRSSRSMPGHHRGCDPAGEADTVCGAVLPPATYV